MTPQRCLMSRPRTQTSSLPVGRDAGTPCTTSCRVPPTPRAASCRSPCHYPSCTSTLAAEMEAAPRTARSRPRPTGRPSRGTAKPPDAAGRRAPRRCVVAAAAAVTMPFIHCRLVAGG